MSIFDDDGEQRNRSLADALATSLLRDVFPLMPAWSEQPGQADLLTQAITDDVVGTPPNWLSLGYGTDVATPTAQDLFDEAMRSKRKLPYL
jgi:hypothetical protein